MSANQRGQEIPPMSPAATMGVMPPVKSTVEARRLIEFNAIMTARARGAPVGTPLSSSAWSYTCTRMPVRVVAEGRRRVSRGKAISSCRYSASGRPRQPRRNRCATRSARPLRCTASPIVSTPIRK